MPPKHKQGSKHADPSNNAASSSSKTKEVEEQIAGITPIQIPEKFISPCHWQPPKEADSTTAINNNAVFSAWAGQIPQVFPSDADTTFFGGGGATRSFDAAAIREDNEDGSASVDQRKIMKLQFTEHRTEREERLAIPGSIVSRDTNNDEVAIRRLDNVPLDTVPLDEFYSMLTETSFVKRESMLKKDSQRGRGGDVEAFLDGEPVDFESQYKTMLDHLFLKLDSIIGSKGTGLELPEIRTEPAGRRTIWINYKEVCETLKRTSEEVRSYICNQLTTTSKYDGEGRIHIDQPRLTPSKLQRLVIDYAMSHVYCQSCRGFDTKLVRDPALRLDLVVCNKCESKRSVESSSGGFVAIANRRMRRARALA